MVDFATMIKHVANVRDCEAKLVNSLGDLLVGSIPEAAHSVLEVLLDWVSIRDAVADIGHTMEVEGTNEEALNKASNFGIIVSISTHSTDCNHSGGKSTEHGLYLEEVLLL